MKTFAYILGLALCGGLLAGCSGDTLPPEESIASDLKKANIKPGGESHSMGSTKADEAKMKSQ
jgi:hypothetical protein